MIVSFYLNVFVLITQSFHKLKFLNPAAPTVGPPFAEPTNTQFAIAQGVTIVFFLVVGFLRYGNSGRTFPTASERSAPRAQ